MKTGQPTFSRRTFLLGGLTARLWTQLPAGDPWSEIPAMLGRIKPPSFPARDFNVLQFGATVGTSTDSTAAISKAIDACSAAGGGRVVIPSGQFLTGPIRLKSRVNLHLAEGAVLKFVTDARRYLPVVFTR